MIEAIEIGLRLAELVAVAAKVTEALQLLGSLATAISEGQVITGAGSNSRTKLLPEVKRRKLPPPSESSLVN